MELMDGFHQDVLLSGLSPRRSALAASCQSSVSLPLYIDRRILLLLRPGWSVGCCLKMTSEGTDEQELPTEVHVEAENSNEGVLTNSVTAGPKKSKKKKGKKKGKKFVPLPVLRDVEERLPWVTKFTQRLGRHAVARRPISAGDIVLVERAVAAIPREQYQDVLCHGCLRKVPEMKVMMHPEGQSRIFCSVACQENAHNLDDLSGLIGALPKLSREHFCDYTLLRLITELGATKKSRKVGDVHQVDEVGETSVQELWQGESALQNVIHAGWDDVQTLVNHWDRMDEAWRKSLSSACKEMMACVDTQSGDSVSVMELQQLAAIVNMNAHGLGAAGSENTDVALGLFPVLSLLNHSCRPNCCFNGDGPVMVVRAIRDIEVGEQLCVTYINLMEPRWMRQKTLLDTRFFNCMCERCSEDMFASTDRFLEGVQCPKQKCQGLHIAKRSSEAPYAVLEWECTGCGMVSAALEEGELDFPEIGEILYGNANAPTDIQGKDVKEGKKGKREKRVEDWSGFRPGEVVAGAHKSLVGAMECYRIHNTKDALEIFKNHVKSFEGKGRLGQCHVCIFDALTPIMNCYRRLGDPQGSLKYCQKVIQCMEAISSLPTVELSNFYKCMGEVLGVRCGAFGLAQGPKSIYKRQAQEALRKAVQIRRICCGPKHPATIEAQMLIRKL